MRSDLERHATRNAESTQARHDLEKALAKAQAAAEAAEGRYQTKCKELSMTKLAKPSGIGALYTATVALLWRMPDPAGGAVKEHCCTGGGIGATKLKQDLAAMTLECDALKAQLRERQADLSRVTAALNAKESEYEQLSHSFHQALSRWELRGST